MRERANRHSSRLVRVEHVIGYLKNWRILGRYHGRRQHLDATIRAIAGLLSPTISTPTALRT
ncbi:hypothetical protein [Micromonospora sp. NPDC005324]|uniref:hypothetical protein n=1 Tax=Micromonospora sp. NPDC005324 TaxID=3157033 RepID=UPI0033A561A4